MNNFYEAVKVYRDSPNTFGHEESQAKRVVLKKIMGAVASQRHLQDSIIDARFNEYCDEGIGMRHLWQRLKDNEDFLRETGLSKEDLGCREFMTLPGNVHCVPCIAEIQIRQRAAEEARNQ